MPSSVTKFLPEGAQPSSEAYEYQTIATGRCLKLPKNNSEAPRNVFLWIKEVVEHSGVSSQNKVQSDRYMHATVYVSWKVQEQDRTEYMHVCNLSSIENG